MSKTPLLDHLGFISDNATLRETQDEHGVPLLGIPSIITSAVAEPNKPVLYGLSPLPQVGKTMDTYDAILRSIDEKFLAGFPVTQSESVSTFTDECLARQKRAQDRRLEQLAALTPTEREFVRAALSGEDDRTLWECLADHLLDKGLEAQAELIRGIRTLLAIKEKMDEVDILYEEEARRGDDFGHGE